MNKGHAFARSETMHLRFVGQAPCTSSWVAQICATGDLAPVLRDLGSEASCRPCESPENGVTDLLDTTLSSGRDSRAAPETLHRIGMTDDRGGKRCWRKTQGDIESVRRLAE